MTGPSFRHYQTVRVTGTCEQYPQPSHWYVIVAQLLIDRLSTNSTDFGLVDLDQNEYLQ